MLPARGINSADFWPRVRLLVQALNGQVSHLSYCAFEFLIGWYNDPSPTLGELFRDLPSFAVRNGRHSMLTVSNVADRLNVSLPEIVEELKELRRFANKEKMTSAEYTRELKATIAYRSIASYASIKLELRGRHLHQRINSDVGGIRNEWLAETSKKLTKGRVVLLSEAESCIYSIAKMAADPRCELRTRLSKTPKPQAVQESEAQVKPDRGAVSAAHDFSSLEFDGVRAELNPAQRVFVRALHRAFPETRTWHQIRQEESSLDKYTKPLDVFRSNPKARSVYDRLIVFDKPTRTYKLAKPLTILTAHTNS